MAVRGLGIATFVDRLVEGLSSHSSVRFSQWRSKRSWGWQGRLSTLAMSGLFDVSPKLDPRTGRFDALHLLSNVGPVFPGRNSVLTVHDLFYRRSLRARDRIYGQLLAECLTRTGRVVAVSTRTASEIERTFPSLLGKVTVIPHGQRRMPLPNIERRHLLSFGGGSDPRKRTDLMVAAYQAYCAAVRDPLPLVVLSRAGLTADQSSRLEELGAQVELSATSGDVDKLVAGAAAILYTTTAEGFGLPIVEAAEVGTPVVMDAAADVAIEVVGRHCIQVIGVDPRAWAAAIRRAIADGPVEDALDLPTWDEVAAQYIDLYRLVMA